MEASFGQGFPLDWREPGLWLDLVAELIGNGSGQAFYVNQAGNPGFPMVKNCTVLSIARTVHRLPQTKRA
jgi:hypothetical protein